MHKPLIWLVLSSTVLTAAAQQSLNSKEADQDKPAVAQPVMVVSSEQQALPAPLLPEARRVNDTAGGASITTPELWDQQKASNIKDLLDFTPGVFVQPRNGAESARVSIRGSGLGRQFQGGGLQLLYDGLPLHTADGSFDFQAIDPWLTDYVTVYRGANGMRQGASGLGGVINFGTTEPQADADHQLRLAAGSFATQQALVSWSPAFDEGSAHAMRLRASHFSQNGFRVQNQQRSSRFDWQHRYQKDRTTRHKSSLFHLNTHAELPSSLSKSLLLADPRQSRGFNINGNFHRNLTMTRLGHRLQHQSHSGGQFNFALFHADKNLVNPVFTYIDRDSADTGLQFTWTHGFNTLSLHSHYGTQDERRRENEAGLPGADRLSRQQQAWTTTLTYERQQPLLVDHFGDRLTATAAIQAVHAQRDITETWPNRVISKRDYQQVNPRLSLLYRTGNSQWFSNLSRSFEAPSFAELNNGNQPGINAPIRAQSADTLELGTRGTQGTLSWDVAVYYSQLDHEFIRFRFPDGATRTTNADDSTHWGLEAALQWRVAESVLIEMDQFQWQVNYQWTRFKLDDDPEFGNNRIPGIPEHYVQAKLSYQTPTGWRIAPHIEWVPTAYYIDLANSFRTDNYLLTGLTVSYQSTAGFEWYLDAKNLTDQTYISTSLPIPDAGGTDGNYFYSGEGRAFYAGIKWSF
ncbi:TonB-dependent receptor family protein [Marinicella meishanensis]|uniref:TonB-dependent receptor family protein n=1 Tax=Marinicella meishanensis TaxID=2873263 RepID=UPI001CC12151|nr:TonB-dependent receptor [Marinicella sp. NBU2979]